MMSVFEACWRSRALSLSSMREAARVLISAIMRSVLVVICVRSCMRSRYLTSARTRSLNDVGVLLVGKSRQQSEAGEAALGQVGQVRGVAGAILGKRLDVVVARRLDLEQIPIDGTCHDGALAGRLRSAQKEPGRRRDRRRDGDRYAADEGNLRSDAHRRSVHGRGPRRELAVSS